ncbi:MAG TPA: glycoside hydrolase family 19 protein [Lysobacter sp.]
MFTDEQLAAALQCPVTRAARWAPHLERAMQRFGITTGKRAALFLAQIGHESLGLARLEENLNYSAARLLEVFDKHFDARTAAAYARQPARIANRVYANRMGNGDEASGDGFRYRGRCPTQLTGRDNYARYGNMIGVDLVGHPDRALEVEIGAQVSAAYWRDCGLNALADAGDVLSISRRINLGTIRTTRMPHGMADRNLRSRRALDTLGVAA